MGPTSRTTSGTADGTDHLLAHQLADQAGKLLLGLRATWAGDAAGLRAEGDRRSNTLLLGLLHELRPD
ncbi:MAG: hypothetical protein ACRCZD_00365, partial [Phycicoccus sp.]